MKRLGNMALGALLACSLVPVPAGAAWAAEPTASNGSGAATSAAAAQRALVPGTYVEHEAIAYVMDGGVRTFSSDGGALEGAQDLMDIAAGAAAEALGDDADAPEAAAFARSLSADGKGEAAAGRLVLVRDEAKTTEQLIADLEADPRVVFAEPNAVVETGDADEETVQTAPADEALDEEWADGVAAADTVDESGATDANGDASGFDATEPSDGAPAEVVFGQDDDGPAANLDEFVWGFRNDGRMGGSAEGDAVDMEYAAWPDAEAAAGLGEVVVAVIDSGVDASNPDLAPVMWNEGLTSGIESTGKEDEYGFAAAADPAAGVTSHTGITSYTARTWRAPSARRGTMRA